MKNVEAHLKLFSLLTIEMIDDNNIMISMKSFTDFDNFVTVVFNDCGLRILLKFTYWQLRATRAIATNDGVL